MSKPNQKESRTPESRVRASCDYCGARSVTAVTGLLSDIESPEELPVAFQAEQFQIMRCTECGLHYLAERPTPNDLDLYYGDSYLCFESYDERGGIMKTLARVVAQGKLKQIRKLIPEHNRVLLDYGCGSGSWIDQIKKLDSTLTMIGMDVTAGPLEELKKRGIEAHCCDETNMFDFIAEESVGVIHLNHVIEHVPSPMRLLEALQRALVPGGVIIGQTPNVASWGCRFWGDYWTQWHAPRHLTLFSHLTLDRHATSAGLEVVSIKSSLSGATQWALSFLHWGASKSGKKFRSTHEPLYPPLILASLPIALLEQLFSYNCHMDFILRKPSIS